MARDQEPKNKHVAFVISASTLEKMDQEAERAGLGRSGWIRREIRRALGLEEEKVRNVSRHRRD